VLTGFLALRADSQSFFAYLFIALISSMMLLSFSSAFSSLPPSARFWKKTRGRGILLCLGLLFWHSATLFAQSGDLRQDYQPFMEWIKDPSKVYVKITVNQTGWHRISQERLAELRFPVGQQVQSLRYQIFHHGKEIPIRVQSDPNVGFVAGDFIEFFAFANEGDSDTLLYENGKRTNPYHSIHGANATYYLTYTLEANGRGKRLETLNLPNTDNLPKERFHLEHSVRTAATTFTQGPLYPTSFISLDGKGCITSDWEYGKGFATRAIGHINGGTTAPLAVLSVPVQNLVSDTAYLPRIETGLLGRWNNENRVKFFVGANSPTFELADLTLQNFQVADLSIVDSLNILSSVNGSNLVFYYQTFLNPANNVSGAYAVNYAALRYPQAFKMIGNSKSFQLVPNPNGTSFVEIQDLGADFRILDITEAADYRLLEGVRSGTGYSFIVPETEKGRRLWVSNETFEPLSLERVEMSRFNPSLAAAANYLIITHSLLRTRTGSVADPVEAYAAYRRTAAGGNYKPYILNIETLYDWFSFGEPNPLAIRRFVKYVIDNGNPEFLFIIGKGFPRSTRLDVVNIMPYGTPPSDHALTAGLRGEKHVPALATGRLAAQTPEEVLAYLNKVKEHESPIGDQTWRKNMLHLSGGKTANEHNLFRRYMEGFADIAEGDYLGAKVTAIAKKTTDFVEFINIADQLNKGLSVVNFFGHASLDFTDIEIGRPSDARLGYNNKGKYPLVIVNGCTTGDIFTNFTTFAEDWMHTPDKGAILFLAHAHLGFSGQLRLYTQTLYETAFANAYYINAPFGKVMQQNIRQFLRRAGANNPLSVASSQQIVLQGDPAVRLIPFEKTDYMVDNSRLEVQPFAPNINPLIKADSFAIQVRIANLGLVDKNRRRFALRIRRTYPNGESEWAHISEVFPIYHEDTVICRIRTPEEKRGGAYGVNRFEVFVDYNEEIDESREDNNYALLDYFFSVGSMITLAPKEYSIVNAQPLDLIAQNANVLDGLRRYEFQIDTTQHFNSPLRQTHFTTDYTTTQWRVSLPDLRDSLVYFWRVRYAEPKQGEDTTWATSSFIHIPNSPEGWSQTHIHQFAKANLTTLRRNEQTWRWEIEDFNKKMRFEAYGSQHPDRNNFKIIADGITLVQGDCRNTRIIGLTIDPNTGEFFNPQPTEGCGASLVAASIPQFFRGVDALQNFIDATPEGYWVIFMSTHATVANSSGYSFATQLPRIGVNGFIPVDGEPFVIIGKKGANSAIVKVYEGAGDKRRGSFVYEHAFTGTPDRGIVRSTLIGPAESWTNVHRKISPLDNNRQGDAWRLDLLGVDLNGTETLLRPDIRQDAYDIQDIDAHLYPYLRLKATLIDSINRTPPQLRRWQVVYREVPEGVLMYDTLSYRQNTRLEVVEGDSVRIRFFFKNISGNDFDQPLQVRYTIRNITTGTVTEKIDTLSTLAAGQQLSFQMRLYSLDFRGENSVVVYINPKIQREQIYENNILQAQFLVKPDDINPVLDVAFDGVHILNGDIVSPQPLITVSLKDENQYLIRQDTVGINLFLMACDTCSSIRLDFAGDNVQWFASADNNFRIEYKPSEKLPDGTYTLLVEGTDVTGNRAGLEPYKISFRVVNQAAITNFYPYPNPFSTSMRFVFTLTGSDVPDEMRIQIMTITGKVVRTIHKDELGAIRIGDNISEFAWDGKDDFGDQLANGVYLYKVYIRDREQDFEKRQTARDDLFKKNIGKIYLMR
jgi:hypothetical protein